MEPSCYDHSVHAGNAGDVWKHFILAETLDNLCAKYRCTGKRGLSYLESHAGRPEYTLGCQGQWMNGIGRLWHHLPRILRFKYFEILADLNQGGLRRYPGSISLAFEISRRWGLDLYIEAWDMDREVAFEWKKWPKVCFHRGDGFLGASLALFKLCPGLLLIDPPYIDSGDDLEASQLFLNARGLNWTVLLWSMGRRIEAPDQSCGIEKLTLRFADAGMDGGRWRSATMALYSPDSSLAEHLKNRSIEFLEEIILDQRKRPE